jgi:hypothetical protein
MITSDTILRLAGLIPEHNLKEVRSLPGFNTWGVDSQPDRLPSILYIGEDSRDFGPPCWPFMAAHEGLHSVATHFLEADDYRFILYNICEDWRVNVCLRGVFHEKIEKSFKEARQVILRRWETNPLKLTSPVSHALQHLCYLNHLSQRKPNVSIPHSYLQELLWMRDQFGSVESWPLVPDEPDRLARAEENERICQKLMKLILQHRAPPDVDPAEIRALLIRMGYDLSFRLDLVAPQVLEEQPTTLCAANHLEE